MKKLIRYVRRLSRIMVVVVQVIRYWKIDIYIMILGIVYCVLCVVCCGLRWFKIDKYQISEQWFLDLFHLYRGNWANCTVLFYFWSLDTAEHTGNLVLILGNGLQHFIQENNPKYFPFLIIRNHITFLKITHNLHYT